MEPQRIAQVEHQADQVGGSRSSAIGYATRASAPKIPGATSSPSAATRNSPVVRLLNSMSSATSPCQFGALVTGRSAYPVIVGCRVESTLMSTPHEEQHSQERPPWAAARPETARR